MVSLRQLLLVLFSATLLQGCWGDQKIFREVSLYKKYGDIELGDDKSDLTSMTEEREGRTYLLSKSFAVAEEIELIFDSDQKLCQIIFTYPANWNAKAAIEKYTDKLGEPNTEKGSYLWNDGATQFEVYTVDGVPHARMIDLTATN